MFQPENRWLPCFNGCDSCFAPTGRSAPTRVFWPCETRQSRSDWLSCGSKKPIGQCDLLDTQRLYFLASFLLLLTLGWLGCLNEKSDWWWLQSLVYFSIGYITHHWLQERQLMSYEFVIHQRGSNLASFVSTLKFGAWAVKNRDPERPQNWLCSATELRFWDQNSFAESVLELIGMEMEELGRSGSEAKWDGSCQGMFQKNLLEVFCQWCW